MKYQGKIQERKHELETTTERNKDSEVYVKLLMKFQQESKVLIYVASFTFFRVPLEHMPGTIDPI